MILKQRFAEGRTNYIDIGNSWSYIQSNADDFHLWWKDHQGMEEHKKDCLGFIIFSRKSEPIFKEFPQWVYSNDGQLFLTLN